MFITMISDQHWLCSKKNDKKRYLINNEVYQGSEMPKDIITDKVELSYDMKLRQWKESLVKLDCDEIDF